MSIPIIDINAGDTMSAMVDKVNYNFSLVSLKGGGPAGIQGIQGIRGEIGLQGSVGGIGPAGSSIYSYSNPDPNSMSPGDINIYDGVIQQVYSTPNGNVLQTITDLNTTLQSPFGISEHETINPVTSFADYPIVFGAGTGSPDNIPVHSDNAKSLLNLKHNGTVDLIRFFKSNSPITSLTFTGHITAGNNSFVIGSGTSDNLCLNGPTSHSICLASNGTYFNGRIHAMTANYAYDNSAFIVATKNLNGMIDNSAAWAIEQTKLFPVKTGANVNLIGLKNREENRVDEMYLNKNASMFIDMPYDTNDYMSIKIDSTSGTATQDVVLFSKYGVAIGGIKGNGTLDDDFRLDAFTAKITTPFDNAEFGTKLTISSRTSKQTSLVASSVMSANLVEFGIATAVTSTPNEGVAGLMQLATGIDKTMFSQNMYGNTITADKNRDIANVGKNTNDTLHIHGADGTAGTGNDVVVTGGNTINTANFNYVGGDVYIAGGSALKTNASKLKADLRRQGNVIIGINPLNHKNTFNASSYTSTDGTNKNASLNPSEIGFFDINDVAIHGNKIVIDSNANFRKATNEYSHTALTSADVSPYVDTPANATLQVSGINTMMHENPVVVEKNDVCSYQFMSGVMRRIIRIRYRDNQWEVSTIAPNEFMSTIYNTNYISGDSTGSVYFITDQVWQKIGNVVNVQAFGRWVANKPGDPNLYHITDYMFYKPATTGTATKLSTVWVQANTAPYCINKTLGKLLLEKPTHVVGYRNITNVGGSLNQPMTTFALPFVIKGMRSSHCYGNGNIYTENPCISKVSTDYIISNTPEPYVLRDTSSSQAYIQNAAIYRRSKTFETEPSGSVISSSPVTVGAYYTKENYDYNAGFGTPIGGNNYDGGLGSIHTSSFNSTNGTYDLKSMSIKNTDPRFTATNTTNVWDEKNFIKTEIMSQTDACFICPEMIADYGNLSIYDAGAMDKMEGRYMRPCVGMYTWISLNYSYTVVPDFTDKFTTFSYSSPNFNQGSNTTPVETPTTYL